MLDMLDFKLAAFEEMGLELGARLKVLRLVKNWQQTELASRAGVSRYVIQELESRGKCSLESFLRLAFALGRDDELSALFKLKTDSIAQMEREERAQRKRAPRRLKDG